MPSRHLFGLLASTMFMALASTGLRAASLVPKGFSEYAKASLDGSRQCVVGAVRDEDGMNAKPFAYVDDVASKRVMWARSIALPAHTVQGRATHCIASGDVLYVLVQSDTQTQQSLSQTVLNVVQLDAATGKAQGTARVDVPGVKVAYSAWVDDGDSGHVQKEADGQIDIKGTYFLMDSPDDLKEFSAKLKTPLNH